MHKIPKSIAISESEKVIAGLSGSVGDLNVVKDWGDVGFSGIATAVQAVITWGKRSGTRNLVLPKTEQNLSETIDDLLNKPHKFVAAMFARSISTNDKGESYDVRNKVNLVAKQNVELQQSSPYGQQRGGLCWFAFVDHSSMGLDRNFYIENSTSKTRPRDKAQLNHVISSMVKKSSSTPGGAVEPEFKARKFLGRIFYELFLNTHQHGTRAINREEWIKPAVRLIYTQGINLSAEAAARMVKASPALAKYVESAPSKARYIEVGIVDSGLGYYGRWTSDRPHEKAEAPSIEDEYVTFRKCFSFRQGSTGRQEKGNGLPVVMQRLTELGGFMRIRSGRLSLYRDFIKEPYIDDETCGFFDWESNGRADVNITEMSSVEGTAITLLVPLEGK